MTVTDTYLERIGSLIRDARRHKGLTQSELARSLGTSQSAVARIEQGQQNLSLETLARIGESLDSEFVSLGHSGPQHLRIVGGQKLHGAIDVKTSKNAAVALLCASLLNRGRTTLRNLARIEEVNRILEVLHSIGVRTRWIPGSNDLEIVPPTRLDLGAHRRRGRAPHPDRDHVPRAAAARPPVVPAPVCGWLRPRYPHRGAAPRLAAPLRARRRRDPRVLRGDLRPDPPADPAHRPHRARRHRYRERPHGRRAARRRHRDPQRQPELHGPGPVLLPRAAGRPDRGHRHHHPDRARRSTSSTSTSSTPPPRTRSRR